MSWTYLRTVCQLDSGASSGIEYDHHPDMLGRLRSPGELGAALLGYLGFLCVCAGSSRFLRLGESDARRSWVPSPGAVPSRARHLQEY